MRFIVVVLSCIAIVFTVLSCSVSCEPDPYANIPDRDEQGGGVY